MNCARFEDELTRLLAGEITGGERESVVEELQAHAVACESCNESRNLLDWAILMPGNRFPDEEPGEEYWESFDHRLSGRLGKTAVSRGTMDRRIWAAAAVIALAVLVGWWLYPAGEGKMIATPVETPVLDELVLPGELEERINSWGDDTVVELIGVEEASLDTGEAGGWLFPETAGLDDEGRQELLDWLLEETAQSEGDQA